MKVAWTQGLDKQATQDIRADFKGCMITRKRLIEILNKKVNTAQKSSRNVEGYECSNWAYKQADSQGYMRALDEVMSLLTEKK